MITHERYQWDVQYNYGGVFTITVIAIDFNEAVSKAYATVNGFGGLSQHTVRELLGVSRGAKVYE